MVSRPIALNGGEVRSRSVGVLYCDVNSIPRDTQLRRDVVPMPFEKSADCNFEVAVGLCPAFLWYVGKAPRTRKFKVIAQRLCSLGCGSIDDNVFRPQ